MQVVHPCNRRMYVALATAQWVVAKALAPVADGVLGAWAASRNFGFNIEALSTELLLVKATLEQAALKELGGPAMEMLLQKLRDTAHNAEDLLDKLDYFRIHDKLHGTYDAADKHGKGSVRNLAFNAHHTAKAVGKLVNCCTWQRGKHQQRSCGDSSSPSDPNQEVSRCMPKFSKLLPCLASSHPHDYDADCGTAQETPKLDFNRVDFSQRMMDILEKLQFMRNEVNKILQGCGPRIVPNIAHSRPISKGQIDEPKLYGRDCVMNSIIHDITKGQYCDKGLSVLPVVGPGGMGKTTLIQHIYRNQQVQNHFSVMIWICVSLNFNLDKVLEHIKRYTPRVESEKECTTTEDLIEHRLKSKRFLFVLDDIWQITSGDWKKLLSTLNQSQEKGCMILVTTRFQAIAQEVITTGHPIELNGLESKEFSKLFLAFIFDDEQCASDNHFLLETGDKIMEKLKGSPLAAKTVGRLLSKDLSLSHWRSILKSKEWEKQTDNNEIMPALKLSYDFLPFHLQQCFSYSGLFPEDCYAKSHDLISLWIGLDILIPTGQNPTFEDIGLSNLNDLVIHGFFKEEETDVGLCYVMHDLLHDLALKVASHDCLSLHLPDVGSIEIQPSTRHLCISTKNLDKYDPVFGKNLKSELEELKTRLKVEHLHTLILLGELDESSAKIFGEFLWEANALRVLYLPDMMHPVESILNKFSGLVHLRCIYLGTRETQLHLPHISNFYHLKILNLESWNGNRDFPEDMSNLVNLCHFFTPIDDEVHYEICNVGDLKLLEELKVFRVNNKSEGFEPKQLEHLTKLRELGIYNLEKINTKEEATQAKLIEKKYLKRLTLGWDIERSSVKPSAEAVVLESLQPHGDLQVLCIRGHGGPSCPTWLGDEFAVEALQSLYLYGVSWETFPSLGKAWDLHELRLEHIARLKEFIVEKSFCRLTKLILSSLESFEKWIFASKQEYSPGGDLLLPNARIFPLLQVLIIIDCPKLLGLPFSNDIVSLDWFPKLQELEITDCPEFSSVLPVSWIENLRRVTIKCVKLLEMLEYRNSFYGIFLNIHGKADLHSLDQVLVFNKETSLEKLTLEGCPPLELKHLLMLTSLKKLAVKQSVSLVGPLGVQSDVERGVRAQHIRIGKSSGNTGKELTELLPHLPSPSKLEIRECKNMTQLVVFPLLQVLIIRHCPALLGLPFSNHIVFSDWFPKVQELEISDCPEFSSMIPISWIESLCFVTMKCVKLLEEFAYSKSSDGGELKIIGKRDLRSFDQVLVLDKETGLEKLTLERCPPLELKHLLMLTSLKTLVVNHSDDLVGQLGGQGDAEWKLPFWFPKLQKLEIRSCPEFSPVIPVSWIESLLCVMIEDVKLLKRFAYSKSSNGGELEIIGEGDLHSLDQVLFFDKETCIDNLTLKRCPPLELKHLLMLTSLKTLSVEDSESLVGPLGGQGNVEWQLPIEHIWILELNGNIGEELTELLLHLPKLSKLNIYCCKNLKKLVVGVDVQKTSETSKIGGGETIAATTEEDDDGLLLFLAHLCETLRRLEIHDCPELVLVDQPNIVPGGGWFQALRSLRILNIGACLKFLSAFSFPGHLFPSSLRLLELSDVEGMGTLEPLSNLSSLIRLYLHNCRGDLKCEGLQSIITSGGQLNNLHVTASPKFFADWDPNPRQASEDVGGEEHQKQLVSSTLQELYTDDVAGLLAAPICSFLSTSLTKLKLRGNGLKGRSQRVKRFSKEQEDALQLLSSLQELVFSDFYDLQQLPAGLHNLTSLKILLIRYCPDISSLPTDGLPESLRELNVEHCRRLELEQQCSGLDGTTPEINIC